jgi:hypothetical protein
LEVETLDHEDTPQFRSEVQLIEQELEFYANSPFSASEADEVEQLFHFPVSFESVVVRSQSITLICLFVMMNEKDTR